jgi:hypothetical protein
VTVPGLDEGKFQAAVKMIGRMHGEEFQIRYCEEVQPVVWIACARWGETWQAAGGMNPWRAVFRLLESVMDGGRCLHCNKPTAIDENPPDDLITATEAMVCWYRFDPELDTFRRQCEGVDI